MSRDKQISEMRYLADEMGKAISTEIERRRIADERKLEAVLKENGWRKSTDVAEEIFAEIERLLDLNALSGDIFTGKYFDVDLKNDIAELKKKYTESENNNE